MVAVMGGHTGVVQHLLEQNADTNHAAADGCTALMAAAFCGHVGLIRDLFRHGCSPLQVRKDNGASSLHIAATLGHVDAVAALLKGNAPAEAVRMDGSTSLLLAAQKGHTTVVRVLLAANADPQRTNVEGTSPLAVAAHCGHLATVRLLLHAGVSPNSGRLEVNLLTVLMRASSNNHVEICKLLGSSGVDLQAKSVDGRTAADYAEEAGHLELAAWLRRISAMSSLQIALVCRMRADYAAAMRSGWADPDDCMSIATSVRAAYAGR